MSRSDPGGRAIATGLRTIHQLVVDDPVVVHGDACAPNTLLDDSGKWPGNVDFGELALWELES